MGKKLRQSQRNIKGKPGHDKLKSKSTRKQFRTKKFDRKKTKKTLSNKRDNVSVKPNRRSLLSTDAKESTPKSMKTTVKSPILKKNRPKLNVEENKIKTPKIPKLRTLPRKKRKEIRQQLKPNFELAKSTKSAWEKLRLKKGDPIKRETLIGQLISSLEGKMRLLALRHDTSRVIQTMIKHGNEPQLAQILEEIKTQIIPICKTKYSKFLITSFLKRGNSQQRAQIMSLFSGHVRELLRHTEGGQVLELAYNDFADKEQRREIHLEIFSPEFKHFKPDLYSLKEVVDGDETKRTKISKNLKDFLVSMETKPVWKYSLIHRVLVEFFSVAVDQDKTDLVQILCKKCVEMLHTRDGALSTMHFIWDGTAKDRKNILNSFKPFLKKICIEDYGYLPIISLFDSVDDTVLVSKIFLSLTPDEFTEILAHHHGRKIYLYLVTPRDPKFFHPDILKILKLGDDNTNSRKPRDLRFSELQNKILPSFISSLARTLPEYIQNKPNSILYLAALSSTVPLQELNVSMVDAIRNSPQLVEHDSAHVVIISAFRRHNSDTSEEKSLLELTIELIGMREMARWAVSNRGALVLVASTTRADSNTKTELFREVFCGDLVVSESKGLSLLRSTLQPESSQ